MKIEDRIRHAYILKAFHLKCAYRYTFPIAWNERLEQICNYIKALEEQKTGLK